MSFLKLYPQKNVKKLARANHENKGSIMDAFEVKMKLEPRINFQAIENYLILAYGGDREKIAKFLFHFSLILSARCEYQEKVNLKVLYHNLMSHKVWGKEFYELKSVIYLLHFHPDFPKGVLGAFKTVHGQVAIQFYELIIDKLFYKDLPLDPL